jgi:hypothetical protein
MLINLYKTYISILNKQLILGIAVAYKTNIKKYDCVILFLKYIFNLYHSPIIYTKLYYFSKKKRKERFVEDYSIHMTKSIS